MSCSDIFLGVIAILFPPVAVWIKSGLCTGDSLINILLCMLGYLPGLLHAWYIIAKYPEPDSDYEPLDAEDGRQNRVTYYYVNHEQPSARGTPGRGYGTQTRAQAPTVPGNKPARGPAPSQGNASASSGSRQPAASAQDAGPSDQGAPPSYNEVVRGDNKIQSQD